MNCPSGVNCVVEQHVEVKLKMDDLNLVQLSKDFAIKIISICKVVREERNENVLINQLLRSGTSIGANIHEGNYASSRLDFINKFQIALKECYETAYWLDIFHSTNYITKEEYEQLVAECNKIRSKLTASIKTAKQHL